MPRQSTCSCTLCELEPRMLGTLAIGEANGFAAFAASTPLRKYASAADLLGSLRSLSADSCSDQLLAECLKVHSLQPVFVGTLLTVAFLPMLHRTVRRVLLFQSALAEEDVSQEALRVFLQILQSNEIHVRRSHFAFAISRSVKRQLFAWAQRESMKDSRISGDSETSAIVDIENSFEPHAELHHFLDRCVRKGDLTDAELDLLIQYKLEANRLDDFEASNGQSSNALRQRLKRLIAKLRRVAQS